MQISNYNINFKAKTPTAIKADKALRIIHANFPLSSNTKLARFSVVKNNPRNRDYVKSLVPMIKLIRTPILISEINDSPTKFYEKFMRILKKHKMGNCGELVKLFNFILDLNGIKAEKGVLCPSDLNHCVSIIPLKEKAIDKIDFKHTPMSKMKDVLIADPWLDIIDYAPNIAARYKNDSNYFRFIGDYKKAINKDSYFPTYNLQDIYLHPKIGSQHPVDEAMREHFKNSNPELFIEKGKQLIKH